MASTVEASAKGASYLILVQVSSRALTFIINQALLRFLSPELLGASTQLELYSISVLYFARESFRVALQRQASNPQAVVNISYLAIALGLPLAYFLAKLYSATVLPDLAFMPQALNIYAIATIIELVAEPPFVVVQQLLAYRIRAISETVATFIRCIVTFLTVVTAQKQAYELGVLPFAFGQLSYAIFLVIIYYAQTEPIARLQRFSLLPSKVYPEYVIKELDKLCKILIRSCSNPSTYVFSYFSRDLCSLSLNLYFQSGIKYLLTQGDSLLIAYWTTLREQGAFALASNYGGLIARMLFQPIEESSRNLFAKLCAPEDSKDETSGKGITQAQTTLKGILKFYNLLALVSFALGPTLAPLLLDIVAGNKWANTGAATVLSTYCYYIPLLAINGITEAFVAAVASNSELRTQSFVMTLYSAGFAAAAFVFLRVLDWGATGLVYANCLNMALRIVWNVRFIMIFFLAKSKGTYPNFWTVASGIGTATVLKTYQNQQLGLSDLTRYDVLQIGTATGLFLATIVLTEQSFILQWIQYLFPNRFQSRKRA